MNLILLKISISYICPLLVALSLVLLYRGHNLPGGGFIGGLVAASSLIYYALAHRWDHVELKMPTSAINFIIIGLGLAFVSGLFGPLVGEPFMKGLWLPPFELPLLGKVKLGTPLLFDIGVYFAVIGFTVKSALAFGKGHH